MSTNEKAIKELEHQIILMHQKLHAEIIARKSISSLAENKMYSIEKREKEILSDINDVLEAIKETEEVSDESINFKIELTQFKNTFRKLLKESKLETKVRMDNLQDMTVTSITELELVFTNLLNYQVKGILDNFKAESKNNRLALDGVLEQIAQVKEEALVHIEERIQKNTEEISSITKEAKNNTGDIIKSIGDIDKELNSKVKAVQSFTSTKFDTMADLIQELEESISNFKPQETKPQETKQLESTSALSKDLIKIAKDVKLLEVEYTETKQDIQDAIIVFQKGNPELTSSVKELQSSANTMNDKIQEISIVQEVQSKKLHGYSKTIETTEDSIENLRKSLENKLENKDLEKELTEIAVALLDNKELMQAEIDIVNTDIKTLDSVLEIKDTEISDLKEELKDTNTALNLLRMEFQLVKETVELMNEVKDAGDNNE